MATWTGDKSKPLVSICCITYNHEDYIRDAIEGFLIQETSFPFEILIHDDASTDGTADIIRQFESMYPDIIQPILQTENQYSQGVRPLANVFPRCKGNYIAVCEGDDYWTDNRKLQIQVSFLAVHSECVISHHNAIIVNDDGDVISNSKLPKEYKRSYSAKELILGKAQVLTMTWMMRNVCLDNAPERGMVTNGDVFILSLLGHFGESHYHPDIKPAVYRLHNGGVWSALARHEQLLESMNSRFWIYRYYRRIGELGYANMHKKAAVERAVRMASSLMILKELFKRFPLLRWLRRNLVGRG